MAYKTGSRRPVGSGKNTKINIASGRNATGSTAVYHAKVTRVAAPEAMNAKGLKNTITKNVKTTRVVPPALKKARSKSKTPMPTQTQMSAVGAPSRTTDDFVSRVLGVVNRMKGK